MGENKVICQLKNDLYFYFYQCLFFAWYKNVFINVFKKTWSLFFTYYEIEQGQTSVKWKNNEHINESASYFPIFLYFEKKISLMETLIELSPWHSSGTRKFYTEIYLLWNLNTSLTASEVKMIDLAQIRGLHIDFSKSNISEFWEIQWQQRLAWMPSSLLPIKTNLIINKRLSFANMLTKYSILKWCTLEAVFLGQHMPFLNDEAPKYNVTKWFIYILFYIYYHFTNLFFFAFFLNKLRLA